MRLFISAIFPIIWVGVVFFIIYAWTTYFTRKGAEKRAYKVMIANPNDATVKAYIEIFNKTTGFIFHVAGSGAYFASKHREDRFRQAQGYEIISASSTVSELVKQELYSAFISEGVAIQLKTK